VSLAIAEAAQRATVAPGPRLRSVLALTRVEGRRLITHPAILVAAGLVALFGVRGFGAFPFLFLSGMAYFVIGIGTLVAASLCASRSRRDRTEEVLASLPLRAVDRTTAQLLSVVFPLTGALAIAGVLALANRPWAGASARLDIEPRTVMHGLPDFAQGPLLIAFLGVAGVMLARWLSAPIGVPVAIGGIVAINSLTGLSSGPVRWLNPASNYSATVPEPASVMAWHLVYLVGLILVVGLLALAQRPRARGLQVYAAVAAALTALGGVMQIVVASS
jgi:hypothetical protein